MERSLDQLETTITELHEAITAVTYSAERLRRRFATLREWVLAHPLDPCEQPVDVAGACGTCLPCRVRYALEA